jgi:hypothetical protein
MRKGVAVSLASSVRIRAHGALSSVWAMAGFSVITGANASEDKAKVVRPSGPEVTGADRGAWSISQISPR